MPRSALILSCALHGGFLALVGWSSLLWVPRPAPGRTALSVSISQGENSLVAEESPAPQSPAEAAATPVETSFVPPAPTTETPPVPMPAVESTPPVIATTSDVPPKMPSFPQAKRERAPKTGGAVARRNGSGNAAAAGPSGGGGSNGNYVPPHFLVRYKPPYPPEARAQRIEGVVLLIVGVDAEGRVTNASVREGSGHGMLDRAALEAVRTWRFAPATQSGRPVAATVEIPIRFNFST